MGILMKRGMRAILTVRQTETTGIVDHYSNMAYRGRVVTPRRTNRRIKTFSGTGPAHAISMPEGEVFLIAGK